MSDLYQRDFYAWTRQQAELLRTRNDPGGLDLIHLAEEIEAMGARDRRELASRLTELLKHLLKWRYQPMLRGASWEISITKQRDAIEDLLADSPSLRSGQDTRLPRCYSRARRDALREMGGSVNLPEQCPFTLVQILDGEFWPDGNT